MLDDPSGSPPTWPAQPHRPIPYDSPVYTAPSVEAPLSLAPRQRLWPAILTLLLLGGLIPETIATSNTPLIAYLADPKLLLFLCAFYGCAALLLRDAWRARNLGWASMILLGVSFGAMNEGVIAGTWWKIPAKGYTLTGGVNWGWATALTMFHVVYSMVISILVVELLFPRVASQPWLRRRGTIIAATVLGLTQLLGLFAHDYQPYRTLALVFAQALIPIALLLPRPRPRPFDPRPALGLWRLRITGFFAALFYFFLIYFVPGAWSPPTLVIVGLLVAYFTLCLWRLWVWTGRAGWGRRQELALITGALTLSLIIVSLQPGGEILMTIPFFILLVWLAFRERRLEARDPVPAF
ncbi:MAG TPA: hypothetical protein VHR15_19860 [Ktedonobacterales bacterium]|jgi:hypothetical protein|nr:hypothetical protein [Ktedonobacterales bacterium]